MQLLKDTSISAITAGFITVLVGFTSSAAIVFQGAQALGATPQQIASWMLALGVGMGLTGIGLSLRYRMPIATAWSTSGAAMLITGATGITMSEAIGAFIVSGVLITLAGFTGWFERIMDRIPLSIAAGMLAGLLLQFGLEAFAAANTAFLMVFSMFCTYLAARRAIPRYAILIPLCVGAAFSTVQGRVEFSNIDLLFSAPVFVTPSFTIPSIVGIALPLFAVTMASQNMPGLAVLRASGYDAPPSPLVGWTGAVTTLLAPFGCFALNLATITAAICTGKEAHSDPSKRYVAGVAAGVFYIIVGVFGATVAAVLAAFPQEFVLAIAGLALIATIGNSLTTALAQEAHREPAIITFLVTASGMSLLGIGSAFWGMIAGVASLIALEFKTEKLSPEATSRVKEQRAPPPTPRPKGS